MPSSVLLTTVRFQFLAVMQTMRSAAYFAMNFTSFHLLWLLQRLFLATFEVSPHLDQPFLLLIRLFLRFREPYMRTGNRRGHLGGNLGAFRVAYFSSKFESRLVKISSKNHRNFSKRHSSKFSGISQKSPAGDIARSRVRASITKTPM